MSDGLYCDGGVIGRNPSPLGGTWVWCLVLDGEIIECNGGVIANRPVTTNNFTELYAALKALQALHPFDGTLWTDSRITLGRLTTGKSFEGIPNYLRQAALEFRRNREWDVKLLAGHPTKQDLKKGYRIKRSGRHHPVSEWNVWCDNECKRLAKDFMEKHNGQGR
jgi:ribonuclease HI